MLPPRIETVYSPRYQVGFAGTPIDPRRGERILGFLFGEGLLRKQSLHRPRRASLKALRQVHTDEYLESLHDMANLEPVVGYQPDDALGSQAIEAQRFAVGGTLLATRLALEQRRTVINLGGGFHHATAESGRAFCIFNDVAVAIRDARRRGFDGRILVVDLDLHDCNGTRRIFADDPTVFTFSIHNLTWDEEPAVASLAVELDGEVGDDEYLAALDRHLPEVIAASRPELVFYLAGTDAASDDRIGNWRLTARGLLERDRRVTEAVRELDGSPPMVVLLSGGYGAETWRYSARYLGWLLSGEVIEPPDTGNETLARLRDVVGFLAAEPAGDRGEDGLWSLSEEDIYGSLGETRRRSRLLDHFSPHGLELVLERSGLFDRLRAEGFLHPTLDFDLDNPAGQTLRVWGEPDREDLLVELRVLRDRAALPGAEVMRIEWLLLQNPRAEFPPDRPPLPGQSHPGLGLLREVMALLVLLCEQVQLDGILFVASHYHLASKGRKYLRFVSPDDQAWYRSVREAVGHLPLAAASQAVNQGRVVDVRTGESIAWRPLMMVIPLRDALRQRLESDAFQSEADALRSRYDFRLA